MKIYLHIGTEKTGTTSIQEFMARNKNKLLNRGILYSDIIGFPNNTKLSVALQDSSKVDDSRVYSGITTKGKILNLRENLLHKLEDEIKTTNPNIFVISSEHLSSRLTQQDEIERLCSFLKKLSNDITVIIYLRRQDKFFESLYSTAIKKGHVADFHFPNKGREREDFHYWHLLKKWEKSFGSENIKIRIFDKKKLINNDVVDDFIQTINIPIQQGQNKNKEENISFGIKKLAFLKLFNQHVPEIIDKKINPYRGDIEHILDSIIINDEPLQMEYAEKVRFLERFRIGNANVCKKYFPKNRKLFDDIDDNGKRSSIIQLSSEDAIEIASKIWSFQEKEKIEQKIRKRLKSIEVSLAKNRLNEALMISNNFIRDYSEHSGGYFLKAKVLFEMNEYIESLKLCKMLIEKNKYNLEFREMAEKINDIIKKTSL